MIYTLPSISASSERDSIGLIFNKRIIWGERKHFGQRKRLSKELSLSPYNGEPIYGVNMFRAMLNVCVIVVHKLCTIYEKYYGCWINECGSYRTLPLVLCDKPSIICLVIFFFFLWKWSGMKSSSSEFGLRICRSWLFVFLVPLSPIRLRSIL